MIASRALGRSGLSVAPLAFGGNVLGWTADETASFAVLDAFVDEGLNLIDTADSYSHWAPGNAGGESETLIGKWLARSGKRNSVIIATKVGSWQKQPGLTASNIEAAVNGSLARLQTDVIDLYQAHRDDPKTSLEETMSAFEKLVKAGKVRAVGASNYSADRLTHALKLGGPVRFESLQPWYNLYDRAGYEQTLEPVVETSSLGVISYFSLARGFLSGKYRSEADVTKSPRGEAVKTEYFNDRGWSVLRALDEVAQRLNATKAQVALAWLMARPSVTAPIAGASNVEQLRELAGATRLRLGVDDLTTLEQTR